MHSEKKRRSVAQSTPTFAQGGAALLTAAGQSEFFNYWEPFLKRCVRREGNRYFIGLGDQDDIVGTAMRRLFDALSKPAFSRKRTGATRKFASEVARHATLDEVRSRIRRTPSEETKAGLADAQRESAAERDFRRVDLIRFVESLAAVSKTFRSGGFSAQSASIFMHVLKGDVSQRDIAVRFHVTDAAVANVKTRVTAAARTELSRATENLDPIADFAIVLKRLADGAPPNGSVAGAITAACSCENTDSLDSLYDQLMEFLQAAYGKTVFS